jgi:hypothetical protein
MPRLLPRDALRSWYVAWLCAVGSVPPTDPRPVCVLGAVTLPLRLRSSEQAGSKHGW